MSKPKLICTACGSTGEPRTVYKVGAGFEVTCWLMTVALFIFAPWPFGLLMLIFAVISSAWRANSRASVCRSCGGSQVIPLDSPAAVKMIYQQASQRPRHVDPVEEWERQQSGQTAR